MIQLYIKGIPVTEIRRWFDKKYGLKINLSTLCTWISAYKREGFFSPRFRNVHNRSTVQDVTNRTLSEYLTYGAEVENLENWAVLGSLRNGGQGEDGAQVESLGRDAIPSTSGVSRDAIPSTSGVSRDASTTTTTTMNESTDTESSFESYDDTDTNE